MTEQQIHRLKAAAKSASIACDMFDNAEFNELPYEVQQALYKVSDGHFALIELIKAAEQQLIEEA